MRRTDSSTLTLMKKCFQLIAVLIILVPLCVSADDQAVLDTRSAADVLLREVRSRMPLKPVLVAGTLHLKGNRQQNAGSDSTIEAVLDFSTRPMAAEYTVRSGQGATVEKVAVFRKDNSQTQYRYSLNNKEAEMPELSSGIADSEITWLDLTLSFLWWEGGELVDTGNAKGRDCYIIQVPSPEIGDHLEVRLWIDCKHMMMMQAEEISDAGEPVRRVSVKSFKKIDDEWMIKDLEVRDLKSRTRTILRIDSVTPLAGNK